MITAAEARLKSNEIRFKDINPEKQWEEIREAIKDYVNGGQHYLRWYVGEIHPDNVVKLTELGYSVRSAGLNSSSKPHDAIYW